MQSTITNAVAKVAVILTSMMGAAVTTLMPLLVGALSNSQRFSEQETGFLAAADMFGILLISVTSFFWVRRVNWRLWTVLGLLVFITSNALSQNDLPYYQLLFLRMVAGVACGITYAISIAALGDFKSPDRAFAVMVTAQVVFGTVGFWWLPDVVSDAGFEAIFAFFNWFLLPALFLTCISYPTNLRSGTRQPFKIDGHWLPALFVFSGTAMYYFAQGTAWAYLERIGVLRGMSEAEVGQWLGIGFAISAAGSMLTPWLMLRWGITFALWLTAVIQVPCVAALCFMTESNASWIYAVATVIYQFMWSFVVPIMMSMFNDADRNGRFIVFCLSAFKTGLVIGPPIAGLILTWHTEVEVLWAGALAIVISMILLHGADYRLRTQQRG